MNYLDNYINAYNKLLLEADRFNNFIDIKYNRISVDVANSEIITKNKNLIDTLIFEFKNKKNFTIKDAKKLLMNIANKLSGEKNNSNDQTENDEEIVSVEK